MRDEAVLTRQRANTMDFPSMQQIDRRREQTFASRAGDLVSHAGGRHAIHLSTSVVRSGQNIEHTSSPLQVESSYVSYDGPSGITTPIRASVPPSPAQVSKADISVNWRNKAAQGISLPPGLSAVVPKNPAHNRVLSIAVTNPVSSSKSDTGIMTIDALFEKFNQNGDKASACFSGQGSGD